MNLQLLNYLCGDAPAPSLSYLICATPRSGSNLLGSVLSLTNLAGYPQEYFLHWYKAEWFGGGNSRWRLSEFALHLSQPPRQNSQAISWAKATQSNQWLETEKPVEEDKRFDEGVQRHVGRKTQSGIAGNSNGHAANLKYDFEQIAQVHLWFVAAERTWEAYFRGAGIQPYRVIYEDFVEAYEPTIRGIFDYLEIPLSDHFTIRKSTLKKQSDALNEEWAQCYTTDLIERFHSRDEAFRNSLEAYARGNILPDTKLL
jgi:LPS sulfotransferase NodH